MPALDPDRPFVLRRPDPQSVRDVRGALRLVTDGVRRTFDELENVHARLAQVSPPVLGRQPGGPDSGWAVVLYRGLRGSADLVGGGLDLFLASLQAWAQDPHRAVASAARSHSREAGVAVLHALLGDHLHRSDNPLACDTAWTVEPPRLPHLLVLAHDLGLAGTHWDRGGPDLGRELGAALGATPAYLRYNAGRHVWSVGREVASSLEKLVADWPVPVRAISLLGHGHGGLVLRSALQQATRTGQAWPDLVRHLVFLGTPHAGAPVHRWRELLARAGAGTHAGMLLARLAGHASEGLDDFVHGRWLEQDAAGALPAWPAGLQTYAIAGATGDGSSDGVVQVASALGRDLPPGQELQIPEGHRWIARGTDHLGLLHADSVRQQVRQWLSA